MDKCVISSPKLRNYSAASSRSGIALRTILRPHISNHSPPPPVLASLSPLQFSLYLRCGARRVAMEAGVGLALQSRAAGFGGSDRRRSALYGGGGRARIGSLRVAEPAVAKAAVWARGSKPVAPLRAKKSSGGTGSLPFFFVLSDWLIWQKFVFLFWTNWRSGAIWALFLCVSDFVDRDCWYLEEHMERVRWFGQKKKKLASKELGGKAGFEWIEYCKSCASFCCLLLLWRPFWFRFWVLLFGLDWSKWIGWLGLLLER